VLPFFLLHQPVIIVIAYYVVQWDAGIFPKLVAVVIGSLLVTLSLYEFVIRRVGFLRTIFGMKATAESSGAQPHEATHISPERP
jgi:glucans biosynthesis protein C